MIKINQNMRPEHEKIRGAVDYSIWKRILTIPRHADDILLHIMVRLRWELIRPKNDKRGRAFERYRKGGDTWNTSASHQFIDRTW
jgi:hypothetical protein